jgi:hypothetical protein
MVERYSSNHPLVAVELKEECSVETTFDFVIFDNLTCTGRSSEGDI